MIPGFVIRETPGQYRIIFHEPILPREGTFRRQMLEMQDVYRTVTLNIIFKRFLSNGEWLQPFLGTLSEVSKNVRLAFSGRPPPFVFFSALSLSAFLIHKEHETLSQLLHPGENAQATDVYSQWLDLQTTHE